MIDNSLITENKNKYSKNDSDKDDEKGKISDAQCNYSSHDWCHIPLLQPGSAVILYKLSEFIH